MKIQIASDLHFEFQADVIARHKYFLNQLKTDCDVLVLAGDVADYQAIDKILPLFAENFSNIVYIAGNHEFYGGSRPRLLDKISKIASNYSNFHFLEKSIYELNGFRFLGGTLWFPKNKLPKKDSINDFSRINRFNWAYQENTAFISFLNENLQEGDIVVSHHAPSILSVLEDERDDVINNFYYTDMTNLIKEKKPRLWFHGHIHSSSDYIIDNTRIVANPYGYAGYELNFNFNFRKVIEL